MEAIFKRFQLCVISFLIFLTILTQTFSSTAFDDTEYEDWESNIHIPNSILTYGYVLLLLESQVVNSN